MKQTTKSKFLSFIQSVADVTYQDKDISDVAILSTCRHIDGKILAYIEVDFRTITPITSYFIDSDAGVEKYED